MLNGVAGWLLPRARASTDAGACADGVLSNLIKKANPNRLFAVLIRFLYQEPGQERRRLDGPSSAHETAAYEGPAPSDVDLDEAVLKCLLDMTRRMPAYVEAGDLDIDRLLLDIHEFLCHHPPSQYRGVEFKPLRLLKTMINQLIHLKGQDIRQHLTLVPVHTNPTISSYLDLLFKNQRAEASRHAQQPEHQQQRGGGAVREIERGQGGAAQGPDAVGEQGAALGERGERSAGIGGSGNAPVQRTRARYGEADTSSPTDLLFSKYKALRSAAFFASCMRSCYGALGCVLILSKKSS